MPDGEDVIVKGGSRLRSEHWSDDEDVIVKDGTKRAD